MFLMNINLKRGATLTECPPFSNRSADYRISVSWTGTLISPDSITPHS